MSRAARLVFCFLFLSACNVFEKNNTENIVVDGSSTLYPITEKIIHDFSQEHEEIGFTHAVSGTSGGLSKLCQGTTQIANASRKITPEESELCTENSIDYLEIEVAKGGIAFVVNSENYWVDYLTVEELKMLWSLENEHKVELWSDIRPSWPDKPIALFGPSSASGTYDYFTQVILNDGPTRGDYVASENDKLLVDGVALNKYGLGFFGFAYYKENYFSLKLVPIDDKDSLNGKGPITPTENSVKNGTYQPLSRSLYLYVSKNALQNQNLQNFVEYYLIHATNVVTEIGNIPQSENIYQHFLSQLDSLKSNPEN